MNNQWKEIPIGDFGKIVTGKTPPTKEQKYFNGAYMFVSPKDLSHDSKIISTTETTVTKKAILKFKNQVLPQNSIFFTSLSYGFGKMGIAKETCITNQQIHSIVVDQDKFDNKFVFYLIKNSIPKIRSYDAGIVTPIVPKSVFCKIKLNVPPVPTQRKIATILSAYDDLIENNLKRIKLLEEKAQLTYEEWFVRMRFPGHETTPIDKETGLPEGWEKVKCFDVMEVLSGGTPKTSIDDYWNGPIQFYTPKDAISTSYTNGTEKTITELGLSKCNSKLYPKDTVFITARGTVGKVNLASEPMAMNQSCYALRAKDSINQLFLFDAIKNIVGAFKSAASGGVFDTIIVDTFKFLPITIPNKQLADKYESNVKSLYSNSLILQKQNQLLKEARDILLPRLMTGMIDVDTLITE